MILVSSLSRYKLLLRNLFSKQSRIPVLFLPSSISSSCCDVGALVVASLLCSRQVGFCESRPRLSNAHSPPQVVDHIFKQVSILSTSLHSTLYAGSGNHFIYSAHSSFLSFSPAVGVFSKGCLLCETPNMEHAALCFLFVSSFSAQRKTERKVVVSPLQVLESRLFPDVSVEELELFAA